MPDKWPLRILTLAAWALAAWSATYWALQFAGGRAPAAVPVAAPSLPPAVDPARVAQLFGPAIEAKAPEPMPVVVIDPSTRFSLVGVVADRARTGVALLSVEGRPARPYRVGSDIDNSYTLKSVTARSATLFESATGTTFTVDLAAPGSGPGIGRQVGGIASLPGSAANPAAALPGGPSGAGAAGNPTTAPGTPMPRFGPLPSASMSRRSS